MYTIIQIIKNMLLGYMIYRLQKKYPGEKFIHSFSNYYKNRYSWSVVSRDFKIRIFSEPKDNLYDAVAEILRRDDV